MRIVKLVSLISTVAAMPMLALAAPTTPAPTTPACQPIRTATATVYINRWSWEQDSGVWVHKSTPVATSHGSIDVLTGTSNGCNFKPAISVSNILLNGQLQTVNIVAYIVVPDESNNKRFSASYTLSGDSGKWGFANPYTNNLQQASIGVDFSNEQGLDSVSVHEDNLSIAVWFDDSAQ